MIGKLQHCKIKNIYTQLTGDIIVDDWFEYIEDRKGHTEYDSLEMSENNLYKFEELLTKTIKSYL
jgi:hypothetical protein